MKTLLALLVMTLAVFGQTADVKFNPNTGALVDPVASTFRTANGINDAANLTTGTLPNARLDAELQTLADSTAFFLTLADDANAAAVRSSLGLVIGTDVLSYGATTAFTRTLLDDTTASGFRDTLGASSGIWSPALGGTGLDTSATVADRFLYTSGTGVWASGGVTTFARSMLDDADAATARNTLGAPSTTTGLLIVEGDSLSTGAQWSPAIAALHPTWTVLNQATGGERIDQMSTSYASTSGAARHYARSRAKNVLVLWGGTNDITAAASAATIQGRFTTYISTAEATGFQVVVTTILPAASWSGGQETIRQTVNTWLRANHASKLADIAAVTNFINQADASNLTYFSDGTHLTAAAYTLLVPVIDAAINALPAVAPTVGTVAAQDALNFGPAEVLDAAHAISLHRAVSFPGVMLRFVDPSGNSEGGFGHIDGQCWLFLDSGGSFYVRNTFDGSEIFQATENGGYAVNVRVGNSSAALMAGVGGTITTDTTTTGNVGAGEDTLQTYSLTGSSLGQNGQTLRFVFAGTIPSSAAAKRIRIKWGATTIFDTGAAGIVTSTAMDWRIEGQIVRTGAATQKCIVHATFGTALSGVAPVDYTTATETLTGSVILLLTGEATADNDVVKEIAKVYFDR